MVGVIDDDGVFGEAARGKVLQGLADLAVQRRDLVVILRPVVPELGRVRMVRRKLDLSLIVRCLR